MQTQSASDALLEEMLNASDDIEVGVPEDSDSNEDRDGADEGEEGDSDASAAVNNRTREVKPTGLICSLKTKPNVLFSQSETGSLVCFIESHPECTIECYDMNTRRCEGCLSVTHDIVKKCSESGCSAERLCEACAKFGAQNQGNYCVEHVNETVCMDGALAPLWPRDGPNVMTLTRNCKKRDGGYVNFCVGPRQQDSHSCCDVCQKSVPDLLLQCHYLSANSLYVEEELLQCATLMCRLLPGHWLQASSCSLHTETWGSSVAC
jgi:hypothetical protein